MSEKEVEKVRCLIIGSGPAGYTAAIYASRANLAPVLYEGMEPGGQLTTTNDVENFPGYPKGITGPELMQDIKAQAMRFGADCRWGMATKVDLESSPKKVIIDDETEILADSVIIATGASAKYLGLESEEKYKGSGVSACATCDGFFYRGKHVAVVGGGDTAAEEATYLAGLCEKVYLVIRKDYMRASKVMQERVEKTENIEILYEHNIKEIYGEGVVEGVQLFKKQGTAEEEVVDVKLDGVFIAIGHTPNTDVFKGQLELDESGYIVTKGNTSHTNLKGVFAAGDVHDTRYRQAITAAGAGCKAALDAEKYLMEL